MRRRHERALAGALAALVLVSTLAAVPGAALAINSAVSAQVGDDLATVPDANIQANIPQGARDEISYNISEWRGSVMADQAADSMEVMLTTREAATGQTTPGGPQFALQLTDDSVPDSRTVAVPADAIREAVGYTPVVVTGYHEDGSQWTASAYERGNLIVFDIPHFSTNTVTFGGTLSITGTPATDGSSYSYEVQDVDAVSDFQIGVTGSTAYDRENASAVVGNGGSLPVEIAGNSDPLGPDTLSDPQVLLTGVEHLIPSNSAYSSVTSSTTDTVLVGGNEAPQNGQVTFEGSESTTTASTSASGVSDGAEQSYTVSGNVDPAGPSASNEPQVTFTGINTTSQETETGSVLATGSAPIANTGNLEPTGPSSSNEPELAVTVTSTPNVTTNPMTDQGDGSSDSTEELVGDASTDTALRSEIGFVAPESGSLDSVQVYVDKIEGSSYFFDAEVRLVNGPVDASYGGGTQVQSSWSPDWSTGWQSIPLDSTASVTAGSEYHLEIITDSTDNDGTSDHLEFGVDDSVSTAYYGGYSSTRQYAPNVDITVDSELQSLSVSDGSDTVNISPPQEGNTQTIEWSTLSPDVTSLDFSGSVATDLDYTLDYTKRTATSDPGLDYDNDGSVEASYSGLLTDGETVSYALPGLSTGSNTARVSLSGGSVDWSLQWTEITATEDPELSVNGSPVASYIGVLREGETATDGFTGLFLGNNDIGFDAAITGGGYAANVTWDETAITEDPTVDVDGDGSYEISHVGTISPGSTMMYDAPGLTQSVSGLDVATNNNTKVSVEAQYREVTKTENPTVEVNSQQTSRLGQLTDGETVQLDTDPAWIQSGTNRINVSVGDGFLTADAPQSEVDLDYQHESVDNQTVQYTAQRWSERYNVSRQWLSDQSSASLTIPFKDTVLSIRDVEKRVGSNAWTDLQASDYSLDGSRLTVQLGSITKNTEVGVRVNASRVRVSNGSIHVQEATEQGRKLDTQIAIDSWGDDSYIQLPQRETNLIAYTYNESWSGPTDELRVTADGERRLRLPNALESGQTRVATIPVEAAPQTGDAVISVGQPSSTEPKFVVQPGQTPGDDVEFTFTGAADGTDYILYSQTQGIVRDSGTAQSPLTLSDDDSDETLQFLVDEGEAGGPDDGGGSSLTLGNAPSVAVAQAQANPLGALLVGIIALTVLLGAYWAAKRRRRPTKGWLGDIASFVSTEVVLIGLSIIGIVAALRFNVLALPRPALFVGAVFGIEIVGYLLLRYFGYFDWKIYGAASAIVAIASTQILVPEAVEQLFGSDALTRTLPLVAAFGMYILYRAVEGWRRGQVTQIVVGGDNQN